MRIQKILSAIGICVMISGLSSTVFGQDSKYMAAMEKYVATLDTSNAKAEIVALEDKFRFISDQAKTEWLPYYYDAYCLTHWAMKEKTPALIDSLTGKADEALRTADSLSKKNSEIYCLKALNTIAKISANMMERGITYSQLASGILDQAEAIDSLNPRIAYLRGQFVYGRPKQFGGGCPAAKVHFEKAVKRFDAFATTSKIQPHWGRREAGYLAQKCAAE